MRTLTSALVLFSLIAAQDALVEDKPTPPVAHYWHNWTDGKGVSHLTRCELSKFELKSLSPPAAPERANRQAPVTAVELGPGDVSLGRKGHRPGNIGDETVTLMVIETDVTPTVDQPCRFK